MPSLTGMVGFWATVALNIPDFTRYAKSQKAQALGQAMGLPTAMTLYSFIGVAVTSASVVIFGEAIWDPVTLLGRFNQPLVAFVALIALLVATLTTNVAANVVSPSNDFSNLNPRRISFRTGGIITGILGMVMMPWKLLSDYSAYIFGWLVGYSGLLGPIAGIMVVDYFIVRRRELVSGRSVFAQWNLQLFGRHQLSRAGGLGCRHRRSFAGAGGSCTALALRLRVVCRLPGCRRGALRADAAGPGSRFRRGIMIATETATNSVKFYIDGQWEEAAGNALHPVYNPATGQVIARVPYATADDVDRAARAAHAAFLKWREVPVVDRVQIFYRYKDLLEKHADEVARILTTENGKTLDDARGSVRRAIQMVEVACGMPSLCRAIRSRMFRAASIPRPFASRSAFAPASRLSTFRQWCRCGCTPSPSPAAIRSS